MFGSLSNFEGSLFDDIRRIQREMDGFLGSETWPAGIRAVAKGTYPPINVGTTAGRGKTATDAGHRTSYPPPGTSGHFR